MNNIVFFDWNINFDVNLSMVVNSSEKRMVIRNDSIESNAVIWIDTNDYIQIKPTWDYVISIDNVNKLITIHPNYVRRH